MMSYHKPVLLSESIDGLCIKPNGTYVDATFGGGGHSAEILKQLGKQGKLIAFDQDKDALTNTINDDRFSLVLENFKFLKHHLVAKKVHEVDGILADFGVSSHQIDTPSRGFSTRFDSKLDMRMDDKNSVTAFEIVNTYSYKELKKIFKSYGELANASRLAVQICNRRETKTINTTSDLKSIVTKLFPSKKEAKVLSQVFQALRIEVNGELEAIKELLIQAKDVLKHKGRLSVISYHSLEDRLVKRYIRDGKFEGTAEKDIYGNSFVPFKKIKNLIQANDKEVEENNRARSAKLRIAEKIYVK